MLLRECLPPQRSICHEVELKAARDGAMQGRAADVELDARRAALDLRRAVESLPAA